jgi:hypothetical protein
MSSKSNTVTAAEATLPEDIAASAAIHVRHHRVATRASRIFDRSQQLVATGLAMSKARNGIDALQMVVTAFATSQPPRRF